MARLHDRTDGYSVPTRDPAAHDRTLGDAAWLTAIGTVFLGLGTIAVIFPLVASTATAILVGAVLAAAGATHLVHALQATRWRRRTLFFVSGLLSLGVGGMLVVRPVDGALSLTLLLGLFLLAAGSVRGFMAIALRPHDYWGVLLASGVLAAALGAWLLAAWPEAAGWLLGLVVGADLLVAGAWLVALGRAVRRASLSRTPGTGRRRTAFEIVRGEEP